MKHTSLNIHLYNETHLVKFPFGVPARVLGGGLLLGRCLEAKNRRNGDTEAPTILKWTQNGKRLAKYPWGVPGGFFRGGVLLGRILEAKSSELQPQTFQKSIQNEF